jgi:hypothetical protein
VRIFCHTITVAALLLLPVASAQSPQPAQDGAAQAAQPGVSEWVDNFDGDALDESKWERFAFEGAGGGKLEVKEGELRMRGLGGSRVGVRSREPFVADRFIFEATLAKVLNQLPAVGKKESDLGFGVLCVMFDGSGRNRVEWILTSENTFEAWAVVDGRGERLDNRKLGTKDKKPTLGIVRRGDEFMFMLNGQEGFRRSLKNMPRTFHAMLYGFGSTESHWDSVRVVTVKQP